MGINRAGYVIHSAIHAARPDVACVIHTHTRAGMAVSAMACGLLPLTQTATRCMPVAYHDYEGPAVDVAERERLVADLGAANVMVLRNHGLLTAGPSAAEAFTSCTGWRWRAARRSTQWAPGPNWSCPRQPWWSTRKTCIGRARAALRRDGMARDAAPAGPPRPELAE